ncbi:uncharacterized protein PV09_08021 [Verruconis gallopava]|uniref:Uncharacterized protein n=1 Tax=Verruconis gallopava TaxID=253628 RepID=A0A0D1XEC8_9PEZI|nr:uncharacterized protein PV09_08021 [Verruconis gallopava]KIW00501.1 hypothetical protein PV09_08021 [Verruconis gallopava]
MLIEGFGNCVRHLCAVPVTVVVRAGTSVVILIVLRVPSTPSTIAEAKADMLPVTVEIVVIVLVAQRTGLVGPKVEGLVGTGFMTWTVACEVKVVVENEKLVVRPIEAFVSSKEGLVRYDFDALDVKEAIILDTLLRFFTKKTIAEDSRARIV